MGLHNIFFNELLTEKKILPSNIFIVQDNARIHKNNYVKHIQGRNLSDTKYRNSSTTSIMDVALRNIYSGPGYHHHNHHCVVAGERQKRWHRMGKQNSDSMLLRKPMRRLS